VRSYGRCVTETQGKTERRIRVSWAKNEFLDAFKRAHTPGLAERNRTKRGSLNWLLGIEYLEAPSRQGWRLNKRIPPAQPLTSLRRGVRGLNRVRSAKKMADLRLIRGLGQAGKGRRVARDAASQRRAKYAAG